MDPTPAPDLLTAVLADPQARTLFLIGLLSTAPAWLLTQAVKAFVTRFAAPADTALWSWGVRLLAMLAGGLCGMLMQRDGYGFAAGCGGGVMCAVVVRAAKGYVKKVAGEIATASNPAAPDEPDA